MENKYNSNTKDEPLNQNNMSLKRIFVSIASYRDSECKFTISDLFQKALYPQNVFVGVCLQINFKEDEQEEIEIQKLELKYPNQIRIHKMESSQARGPCYARHFAQKLWKGEEYYLQIDR